MNCADLTAIIDAARTVLPRSDGRIELHEPEFVGNEWRYVKECLDTGWVSSAGAFVTRFEAELSAYSGAKHVVATVNGTSALHLCLLAIGVRRDEEVLVPALTFAATAAVVVHAGAVPHFVDSDTATLGVDPSKLGEHLERTADFRDGACVNARTGRRIAALIVVHAYGHPVDLDPISDVCRRYGVGLIEDAAESLGSFYKGRHTGNDGIVAALSFNGNKIATTGGGGALLSHDREIAERARHLATTARRPHRWAYDHDDIGFNYRMPNINAALGCAQLETLPSAVERKRELARVYASAFSGVPGVRLFVETEFARSNYWLNVLLLDEPDAALRDRLLEKLNEASIGSQPSWTPMHRLPMYGECPRMDLSCAEDLQRRIVNLPSSPALAHVIASAALRPAPELGID